MPARHEYTVTYCTRAGMTGTWKVLALTTSDARFVMKELLPQAKVISVSREGDW